MGVLDDLDLGKDPLKKEEPLSLKGFNTPLYNPKPLGSLTAYGDPSYSNTPKPSIQEDFTPVADPTEQEEINPALAQSFKDIKSFSSDISKLSSDITNYGTIRKNKKAALDSFNESTLTPFWNEQFSDNGIFEAPKYDADDDEKIGAFFGDIDTRYNDFQKRVDAGDQNWFTEDEGYKRASDMLKGKRKYDLIKQKHDRLLKDYKNSSLAEQKAIQRKAAMSESLMSLPENVRWAAKSWTEKSPGKPLSKKAVNSLLDDQKFESPQFGVMGELLNANKIDPRTQLPNQFGSAKTKKDQANQNKRLEAVQRDGIKALQKDISELETSRKLKKHGLLYSALGQIANRSIYLDDREKEGINVDKLKKLGYNQYKGMDIDLAAESMGGEDVVIASTLIENLANANIAYERAKIFFINNKRTDGIEVAKQKVELAEENLKKATADMVNAGFGEEIEKRGRSDSWFNNIGRNLANAWKSGDLLQDASEYTLKLAGLTEFGKNDAQNLIDIMLEMQNMETSETYKQYKMSSSDDLGGAFANIFKHGLAIPEMVIETLVGFFNTYAVEAPKVVGASALSGALTGLVAGPAGAKAGAATGALWGLRLNAGVASFVMEYVSEIISEFEKEGVDWHNPNQFMAAFNNPQLMADIRKKAATKAGGVAFFDIISAGVAGKTARLIKNPSSMKKLPKGVKAFRQELDAGVSVSSRRQTASMAGELAVQGGLGGTGEAVGQLLTLDPGEKIDWDAIAAEMGIEMFGPGGVGFAINYGASKFRGGYAMEDISGATDNVLDRQRTADGVIEQVDQAGLRYERRRFNTAQDYLNYVVEQTGLDLNSPTGYLVSKLVGFAETAGKMGELGIVVSDRTPYKSKATRGAYHKGTIWLNKNALSQRPDSTPFVFLHEGGHFIQDQFFTPEQAKDLYVKALPDENSRKLAWAQYKLGRTVENLEELSSSERELVNSSYLNTNDTIVIAEWFTSQVAAALAIESGTAGGITVDSSIKKAVRALMKFVTKDENVDQFFPPNVDQDSAVRVALLQQLGFDPVTLQNNRAAFDAEENTDASEVTNPFEVNLSNMRNWDKNTKDVWARILGYKDWASLPLNYRRPGMNRGQILKDRQALSDGDLTKDIDLADPATQKKLYESSPISKEKATDEQKGGGGLKDPAKSPEQEKPTSKIAKAAKDVAASGAAARDEEKPLTDAEIAKAKKKKRDREIPNRIEELKERITREQGEESAKKAVEKKTKNVEVAKSNASSLEELSQKPKVDKAQVKANEEKDKKRVAEFEKKKAEQKQKSTAALDKANSAVLETAKLPNETFDNKIEAALKKLKKDRIASAKKAIETVKREIKNNKNLSYNQRRKALFGLKQREARLAKQELSPLDVLRELLAEGLGSNGDLPAALGIPGFEDIFDYERTATPDQVKSMAERIESFIEENLSRLTEEFPIIDNVLIPPGNHIVSYDAVVDLRNAKKDSAVTVSLKKDIGKEGDIVALGTKEGAYTPAGKYAYEIINKTGDFKYTLKPITKNEARRSVNWLDLPASAIPARLFKKAGVELPNNPFQGSVFGRVRYTGRQGEVSSQYTRIRDALTSKNKVNLSAGSKSKQGIPIREISRLARGRTKAGFDIGILNAWKDPKKLLEGEIDAETARGVATMILAALAPTSTTSKRRVAAMQSELKANLDPKARQDKVVEDSGRAESYEQVKLNIGEEGENINALYGLYERIRERLNFEQKDITKLGAADLLLIDLMNAERDFGFTKDQLRSELVGVQTEPSNMFMGLVDMFRAGIDVQATDDTKVQKVITKRADGSTSITNRPTEDQKNKLYADEAQIEAMSKGVSDKTLGTPDESGSGKSNISSKSLEKYMPPELVVEQVDIKSEPPKEGSWQDAYVNGIGLEKAYNWVRRIAAKLKKEKIIPADQKIITHPEIRELDASLSKAQDDQRQSGRTVLTPRVLAHILEVNGLGNLVSLPDTDRGGRVTEGGPASGMLYYAGILSRMVKEYGKITKGKDAADAGITVEDLRKRALDLFNSYIDPDIGFSKSSLNQFLAEFGGRFDKVKNPRNEQLATAKKQFVFSYFAQFIRKRVAQLGGISELYGDRIVTESESDQFDESGQPVDPDSPEGSSVEDLGRPTQVEEEVDTSIYADTRLTADGRDLSLKIREKLNDSDLKMWASLQNIINMSDSQMAKDPMLKGFLQGEQEFSPNQIREIARAALDPSNIDNVANDYELQKRLFEQIEKTDFNKATNDPILGSELALVSEMPATFSERFTAASKAAIRGGINKLPEELRYKARVSFFNQHATLEDLAVKLNKDLKLKFGSEARDFFDMMGVILPTYAKVKIASRDFDSRFRKPILKLLKDNNVDETEFGRYVQALAAGTFNRHVRGLIKEAREDVQSRIDDANKKIEDHKSTINSERATDATKEELNRSIKTLETVIKDAEKELKSYQESNYQNKKGQFAPSGISDQDAAETIRNSKKDPNFIKLLKAGENNPDKNIMGLWARMNGSTIKSALETGQITQTEAFKLITAKSRASSADGLVNIVFEALGLDPKTPEYAEDVKIIKATFNSENWKKQRESEKNSEIPDGYHYAPMRGFEDNEFHYEEVEAIEKLLKIKTEPGTRGWGANASNEVSKGVTGRETGVSPPNPKTALSHAFLAHDEMVMRGAKIAPGQRMREWYELYLEMVKNRKNLDGDIEWSDNFNQIAEANGLKPLFEDKAKRKVIFDEWDAIFDVLEEHEDGKMPTAIGTRLVKKTVNGEERIVLRKGEISLKKDDPLLFFVKQSGELKFVKFKKSIVNGDGKTLTGAGARLVSELGNAQFMAMPKWIGVFQPVTRFLAQMYTSFNPDFIFANAIRDALNAMANIQEDEKKKITKDLKSAMNPAKYLKIAKAIYKVEKGLDEGTRSVEYAKMNKEDALKLDDNDWEGWFKFFEANGLRTAFTSQDKISEITRDIERSLGKKPGKAKEYYRKAEAKLLENAVVRSIEAYNIGVENTMRLVVAKSLLQKGFTVQQAVMAGRNISVDFNRKGTMSSSIGALVLFFNAGVQGNLRFIKSLSTNKDAAKLAAYIIATSAMWGLIQRMITFSDEDEDGEAEGNHYDRTSDFVKDTNMTFFIPNTDKNIRVPLPWGWNLLWMMGQKVANVMSNHFGPAMGGSGVLSNGANAMKNIYSTFNPVGESFIPGAIAPVYDLIRNETFYGSPITKEDRDFTQTPASERSSPKTKKFFVDASKAINSWMGGDSITPGSLKKMFGSDEVVNPMEDLSWGLSGSDLEHLFEGYTGGPGAAISRLVSGAYSTLSGDLDINYSEVPMARRFYREGYSNFMTSKRFYNLKQRVDTAYKYVQNLKDGGNQAEARSNILANKDLLKIKPEVDAADKNRKTIKRLIDKTNASQTLSEQEKADRIEKYEKQRVARWLKVLYKAKKSGIDV